MPGGGAITIVHYQWFENAAENTAKALAPADTALNVLDASVVRTLRLTVENTTASDSGAADAWRATKSLNGGVFGLLSSTATALQLTNSNLTAGGATTNRLPAGTGTFLAGLQYEGNTDTQTLNLLAGRFTEFAFGCTTVAADIATGNNIVVGMQRNPSGSLITVARALDPTLNVSATAAFTPAQNAYRFAEDGTEAGATLIGTLNTALSRSVDSDSTLQLRIRIQETGGLHGASTDDYQLQYSKNGAAFAPVTSTSSNVKVNTASALTDGGATTNRLGAGSGSFMAGEQEEANGLVEDVLLWQSGFTENVWALTLIAADLLNADALTFRVLVNGATMVYNQTPTIDVTKTGGAFTPAQNAYRFAEDGTEAGATLIGTLNTALSRDVTSGDSTLQLRIRVQETGGAAGAATDDYQLQYAKNGGAFNPVTSTSTNVKINTASALTDGGATTNRLGSGTGSFVAGEQEESDGLVDNHQLTASNYTEHVWGLTLINADLANADALTFRALLNGATITYNQTPTINIVKTPPAATSLIFPALQPSMRALLVQ